MSLLVPDSNSKFYSAFPEHFKREELEKLRRLQNTMA